jgi:hypothetical protein
MDICEKVARTTMVTHFFFRLPGNPRKIPSVQESHFRGFAMKVFASSTCYDLVDLRKELYEDLRDLGVDASFSDIKESDFQATSDPHTNSIET